MTNKLYKNAAALVACMLFALALAACGDATNTAAPAATTAATSATTAPAAATTAATSATTAAAGATTAAAGAATGDEPVYSGADATLTFWQTHNDEETPVIKGLVDAFQAKYPKIKIKMENVPFDGAKDKFNAAAGANQAPDVFRADIGWSPLFASQSYLLDISGKVKDKDTFLDAPFGSNVYNGKIYGLPQVTDVVAAYYNKDLLSKAGITAFPKTMTEFDDAMKKVQATGVTAYYPNFDAYFVQPFFYAFGGSQVTSDKKITINDPKNVQALQFLLDLKNKSKVTPSEIDFKNNYTNAMNSFKEGKTAVIFNGPWASAEILKSLGKEKLGVAPIPAGPDGKQGSSVGGHNYVIYAGSKNPDAAYTFIQWMTLPAQQQVMADKLNLMPTRKASYELASVKANAIISDFGKQLAVSQARPNIPENSDLYKPLSDQIQSAVQGSKTAQQALDDAAKDFKGVLK